MRRASWILLPVLIAGCSGGGGSQEAKPSATTSAQPPAAQARTVTNVAGEPTSTPKAAKPEPGAKPWLAKHVIPWRKDGRTRVVHVLRRRIAVYVSPEAKRPMLRLRRVDQWGTPRAFLVRHRWEDWVQVYLPTRPNGSIGWVKRSAVQMYFNRYRLVVRLKTHKLQLWRERELLATYPVAVGKRSTPTPRGLYYVVDLLKPRNPNGTYGAYSFGLSAHSNVLKRFAGGDGRVGLHGTNQPGLIGSDVSHGCIRLRNGPVRRLARILPLGTPVLVRS